MTIHKITQRQESVAECSCHGSGPLEKSTHTQCRPANYTQKGLAATKVMTSFAALTAASLNHCLYWNLMCWWREMWHGLLAMLWKHTEIPLLNAAFANQPTVSVVSGSSKNGNYVIFDLFLTNETELGLLAEQWLQSLMTGSKRGIWWWTACVFFLLLLFFWWHLSVSKPTNTFFHFRLTIILLTTNNHLQKNNEYKMFCQWNNVFLCF